VFCKKCIKQNLGRAEVTKIEETDEWLCYECDPKPIRAIRAGYYAIAKVILKSLVVV
jgi:hypothetical protein